jgi:uncharacterized membrane protein YcfT
MKFYIFFALGDAIAIVFFKPSTQKNLRNPYTFVLMIPLFALSQLFYMEYLGDNHLLNDISQMTRLDYLDNIKDQVSFLVVALIGCTGMTVLSFQLERWNVLSFLRILGFHSLYIYVMHVIITAFTRLSLIIVFGITNPVVILFTSIIFGVTLPVIFYNFFVKNGFAWFLFGYSRNKIAEPATPDIPKAQVPVTSRLSS